jgi:hypothetical protein
MGIGDINSIQNIDQVRSAAWGHWANDRRRWTEKIDMYANTPYNTYPVFKIFRNLDDGGRSLITLWEWNPWH